MSDTPEIIEGSDKINSGHLSAAEIEKNLETIRSQMIETVDDLTEQLSPEYQVMAAKDAVVKQSKDIWGRIRDTFNEARHGDTEAIVTLVGATVGIVGIVSLCVYRILPKNRR